MSTSTSIPPSPTPGKDPPSTSNPDNPPPSTTPPPTNVPSATPQIASPIPPTPITSRTSTTNLTSMGPPPRPLPLRTPTSDSLLPTTTTTTSHQSLSQQDVQEFIARPNFQPFFTLIHDPATNTTHHPTRVHYLFSDDDDSDLLTSACIRSLEDPHTNLDVSREEALSGSPQKMQSSTSSSSSATFTKPTKAPTKPHTKPPAGKGKNRREERVVIIDINETGDGIISASSLSERWQVLNTNLSSAPTFDGSPPTSTISPHPSTFTSAPKNETVGEDEGGNKSLMLKIEGMGITGGIGGEEVEGLGMKGTGASVFKGKGETGSAVLGEEEMGALLEGFDRKMGILRKVAGNAGLGEGWGVGTGPGKEDGGEGS